MRQAIADREEVATVTVRGAVDSSPSRVSGASEGRSVPPRPPFESRREMIDLLRRFAVYVETADMLDDRARRCASPHLAAVLRDRAEAHRRTAERVRTELIRQATVVPPHPPELGGSARRR